MKERSISVKFLLLCLFGLLLNGCREGGYDLPATDTADYSRGVLVVNEGPWGGTGSITWHDPATGETVQDVFGAANAGASLGQFVQSLTVHDDKVYIVVNGANKIYVVDARTFVYLDTIGPLSSPRFMQVVDGNYAYVSQWGPDGLSGSVAKIDLSTHGVVKTIPLGHGPEKMLWLDNNRLAVANSGGYGVDSTVSIIDLATDTEIERRVQPGLNPASLYYSFYAGVDFFALGKGYWQDTASNGWLAAPPVFLQLDLPQGADDLVRYGSGTLYFSAGGGIYRLASPTSLSRLFDQPAYSLAVHPATGDLYCGDAKDFSSNGEVVVMKPDGTRVSSFPTGVAPGEIVILE